MRIDKIEIDGFGKLNNFSLSLKDGFNLIYGENESGKSTLCAFLLSMFYEMPNDKKASPFPNLSGESINPGIQNGLAGGYILPMREKRMCLKKFWRYKTFRSCALVGWANLGRMRRRRKCRGTLFGLGRAGFLKTLCISGLYRDDKGQGNEEILMRLSNMETSGDEDVSFANIRNALRKNSFPFFLKQGKAENLRP